MTARVFRSASRRSCPRSATSPARPATRALIEGLEHRVLFATVTLSNGTGDGTLSLPVDPYGEFSDANYDPVGSVGSEDAAFDSKVYLSTVDAYLEEGGENFPSISFTSTSSDSAVSSFSVAGLSMTLTQSVAPPDAEGTNFTQQYQITNTTSAPITMTLVRYFDGDLDFDPGIDDFAGASADGSFVFEFDTASDPNAATGLAGISNTGGQRIGYAIQPYSPSGESLYQTQIIDANGIPAADLNQINGDANGDRLTDNGYDVTVSIQNQMTLGAGETQNFTTVTRFGQGVPTAVISQSALPAPQKDPGFAAAALDFATEAVVSQSGGRTLAVGHRGATGASRAVIRRFNADGTPDTTFGGTGEVLGPAGADEAFYAAGVDAADRIVAAGVSAGNFLLARFNADGTPDATFGTAGRVVTDFADIGGGADTAYALSVAPDGSATLGGSSAGAWAFARYDASGGPDASFGAAGRRRMDVGASNDVVGALATQSDGRVIAAGAGGTGGAQVLVARLLPNGDADPAFGGGPVAVAGLVARTDAGEPDRTEGLAVQLDDKVVVANTNAGGDFAVARLTPAGVPDPAFGQNGVVTADFGGDDDADAVVVQRSIQAQVFAVGTGGNPGGSPLLAVAAFDAAGAPLADFGAAGRVAGDPGLPPARFRLLALERQHAFAALDPRTRRLHTGMSGQSPTDSRSSINRLLVPGAAQESVVGTFGTVQGQKKPQTFLIPGTGLALTLKGGSGQVLEDASRPGEYHVALTGTTARSSLTLKGRSGRMTLASLTSDGALGKVSAAGADVIGTLFINGPVKSLTLGGVRGTAGAPATVAASGEISKLTVDSLDHARILSGANLGAEGQLGGGDDAFGAGRIRSFRSNGPITASLVGAGVDPVNGVFGDAGDHAVGGAGSRIDKLLARATVDTTTAFEAGSFGKIKKLGSEKVNVATDPRFHLLT